LSSIFATAAESKKSKIENLQVGSEFTYGHHQLKWRVDSNVNGLMDRDEVDIKKKAEWQGINDASKKRTERNGESFVKELGQAGVPLRTYIKEDEGHGFCSSPLHLETSTLDIDDFLQECGLLDKGVVPGPGKKTSGAWANQHRRQILQSQAKLSQPKVLEFINK
jgi:hypothetical protein